MISEGTDYMHPKDTMLHSWFTQWPVAGALNSTVHQSQASTWIQIIGYKYLVTNTACDLLDI